MTEQLLHCADVVPVFKQMRREAVPHPVRAHALRDAGRYHRQSVDALGHLRSSANSKTSPEPARQVRLVEPAHFRQVASERPLHRRRQHRHPSTTGTRSGVRARTTGGTTPISMLSTSW